MRMIISLFNLLFKIYRTFIFVVIECVCIKFGNNQLFSLKIYILYIYTCQLFAILKISNLELFSDFPPPPSSNDFINQIQSCNWDKYILRPVISMLFLFQSMVVMMMIIDKDDCINHNKFSLERLVDKLLVVIIVLLSR